MQNLKTGFEAKLCWILTVILEKIPADDRGGGVHPDRMPREFCGHD